MEADVDVDEVDCTSRAVAISNFSGIARNEGIEYLIEPQCQAYPFN